MLRSPKGTLKSARVIFTLCFAFGLAIATAAEASKTIPLNQVPPAARKAIETQLAGAKITGIERDEDQDVTFTVSYQAGSGGERDFTVTEDGTLASVEVALQETPVPVQRTIKAQVGPGKLENIEKSFDEDEITYEVDTKSQDGVERSFSVTLE